ncbi:hypothetical protein CHH49_13295 [Terribacillus saccharophilus]|uniref:DUF3953 domain-containing protein n=1 Tax=Terribacillus saccharophilus TaxID=361277 RepID=UPI000BA62360|nr:DUF3953 domain-containing protein [Terribacillus saccharophilus]PAF21019.1 hypothetical protein CHH49_13295 [Terribacillus saccharophilus]
MLLVLRIILAIIVITLSVYGLVSDNHDIYPYMSLFLGLMILVIGISEFKAKRQAIAIMCIFISVFILFVAAYEFLVR